MRIIITGASGLLGANLAVDLGARHDVLAIFNQHPLHSSAFRAARCDLLSGSDFADLASAERPDLIVHCAALTDVERCEREPELAKQLNVEATRAVAQAAAAVGARLVHISTDGLFDGVRGNYREDDTPTPVNVYARTKLEAESVALEAGADTLVVRTNIYGWNAQPKLSLAEWVLARYETGEPVPGFTDAVFSPTLVNDLSVLLEQLAVGAFSGVINVAGADRLSKFDFARRVLSAFSLDPERVVPSTLAAAEFGATRPHDLSLDTSLARSIGLPIPTADAGIERFVGLQASGYADALKALTKEE